MTTLSDEEKFDWLSNDNHRVVLIDLEHHDGVSKDILRLSSDPYVMPIGDTTLDPLDGVTILSNLGYDDVAYSIPNIITRIDADSSIGTISMYNTDGEYDWLLKDTTIVGHNIRIFIGQHDWARDKFITILEGIVQGIGSGSPHTIEFTIRDKKESLNIPLQNQLIDTTYWTTLMDSIDFAGNFTGLISGSNQGYDRALAVLPDTTENTHVPICLGKCFNIEPVLVDSFNHIYLLHDSTEGITSVSEVRSNGVVLDSVNGDIIHSMQVNTFTGTGISDLVGFISGELIIDNSDITITGTVLYTEGTKGVDYTIFYTPDDILNDFSAATGSFEGQLSGAKAVAVNPVVINSGTEGQYEVDLTLGVMRLLDHDQGTQITCDVIGQNGPSSSKLAGTNTLVPYSTADIIEWLLLEKAGIPNDEICYNTFGPAGSLPTPIKPFPNTDEIGFFSKTELTILDVTTQLINSVGGFLRFNSTACNLQIIALIEPEGEIVDLTLIPDDIVYNGISVSTIEEPKNSITLGYKRNWKTQDEGSLAGKISDASSPFYDLDRLNSFMNEYSTVFATNSLDLIEYPLSEDIELIPTNIWLVTDAQAEVDRRKILRSKRRQVLRVQSIATSFTYTIGDIVHITHPRFGFELGKETIIVGTEESPIDKRVTLEVWL